MQKHLKPNQHYSDLYDEFTVEQCRKTESQFNESIKDRIGKKMTIKDKAELMAHNLMIYFETGERYVNKKETVAKWMNDDKQRDNLFENTPPPSDILCNKCGKSMFVESKILHSKGLNIQDEVLFFFQCSAKCKKKRAVFANGQEWVSKQQVCDKCGSIVKITDKKEKNKVFIKHNCTKCDYEEINELDLSEKKENPKIDKLYNQDKERFCLSKEKGQEYYNSKIQLSRFTEMMQKTEEKEKNKEIYDKVANLKRLNIAQLEKQLKSPLKKHCYIKFKFGKTDVQKDIYIEFSVRDDNIKRDEYDSKKDIKKIINISLENTNWRLMSDGINYRLGILNGRLHGYEREEDLVKLFRKD